MDKEIKFALIFIIALIIVYLFAFSPEKASISSEKIYTGVVIQFPNGTLAKYCIIADSNNTAYDIIQKTGLNISWAEFPSYGHGLCGIEGVGCPSDNCFCSDKYWNFLISKKGDSNWTYSPVGFDSGLTNKGCWNGNYSSTAGHFCAINGSVIGLAYGKYGTFPKFYTIDEIC